MFDSPVISFVVKRANELEGRVQPLSQSIKLGSLEVLSKGAGFKNFPWTEKVLFFYFSSDIAAATILIAAAQDPRFALARKRLAAMMTERQLREADSRTAEWQRRSQSRPNKLAAACSRWSAVSWLDY